MTTTTDKLARMLADLEALTDAIEVAAERERERDKERSGDAKAVLAALIEADKGPATRRQLAETMGISPATFYDRYGQALDQAKANRKGRRS